MATATKKMTAFGLACPYCGAGTGDKDPAYPSLGLDLNDLRNVTCGECSEEFTPTEAAEAFAANANLWAAVARWIELAPAALAGK